MKFVLAFLFAVSAFAGDLKVVTTPSPKYTGTISTSVIKDGNKVVATGVTVARPSYAGGGFVTTVKNMKGKTSAVIITTPRPSYMGGGLKTVAK